MKKYYIVIGIEKENKKYAYIETITSSDNLLKKIDVDGVIYANIFDSRKRAEDIANQWNSVFRK